MSGIAAATARLGDFVSEAAPPGEARTRAAIALLDTVGVSGGLPLTQARVEVRLRDGRVLTQEARGARGDPEQPAGDAELDAKFMACASRALSEPAAGRALGLLRKIGELEDVRTLIAGLTSA